MESFEAASSDIAFEILSRADIRTLDLCKTLCKEFNEMTYESNFTQPHLQRTGTISGYFVQTNQPVMNLRGQDFVAENGSVQKNPFGFLPSKLRTCFRIMASTKQGILCCENGQNLETRYIICQPATQQWVVLPNPKLRYNRIKIAVAVVGSNPLHYKIARVSEARRQFRRDMKFHYIYEIFDSKTWRWTRLKDIWLPPYVPICSSHYVVVGGSFYAFLIDDHVLHLNSYTNGYTMFRLPQSLNPEGFPYSSKRLVEYKGKLSIVCRLENHCNLLLRWILRSYRNRVVWQELEPLNLIYVREEADVDSVVGFLNADVLVTTNSSAMIFYNFQKGTIEEVKAYFPPIAITEFFRFRSDSEPAQSLRIG